MGAMILRWEQAAFRELLDPVAPSRILDVGAGTGKLSAVASGWYVAVDSSLTMLRHHLLRSQGLRAVVADACALPFSDQSVDVVVSSRVLMHVPRWPSMVAECCRVARKAVVVDFPVSPSLAALEPALWPLLRRDPHPPHRVFTVRAVTRCFAAHGFRLAAIRRGFVLPVRLHRLLGRTRLSRALESLARLLRLPQLVGSPAVGLFTPSRPEP